MVGEEPPPERLDEHELLVRFWSEPPDRLREETETVAPQRHEHLTVRDGRRWWTYSPDCGAVSNVVAGEEDEQTVVGGSELWSPLLEPAVLIPVLDFELRGEADAIGRPALRVGARPRALQAGEPFFFRTQLPVGADEYELLVDTERGVVLRAAALLDGEEFSTSAIQELAFDPELPPEIFTFEPPPGEAIRAPDAGLPEPVTIEEAARRASFPLFYVPELPQGCWDLRVMYVPPSERPPLKESVHLAYHRADATHHLMVTERPAEERPAEEQTPGWAEYAPLGVEVAEVDRDGLTFTVYRPDRRHGIPLTVVFVREGTAIHLSSTDLDESLVLELAASMKRWERE